MSSSTRFCFFLVFFLWFLVLWVNKNEEVLNVVLDKDNLSRQVFLEYIYVYVCIYIIYTCVCVCVCARARAHAYVCVCMSI